MRRSPTGLLDCAARRFAGLSPNPARLSETEVSRSQNRRCSAALLGSITLASRFAHQIPKNPEAASRLRKTDSSGASSRLAPRRTEALPIACRRRSDLWSPAAPSCRCRLLGRPGPPLPASHKVSRVSWYSGAELIIMIFTYGTITPCGPTFQLCSVNHDFSLCSVLNFDQCSMSVLHIEQRLLSSFFDFQKDRMVLRQQELPVQSHFLQAGW